MLQIALLGFYLIQCWGSNSVGCSARCEFVLVFYAFYIILFVMPVSMEVAEALKPEVARKKIDVLL